MLHSGKGGARETLKLYDPCSGPLDTSGHPLFQIFYLPSNQSLFFTWLVYCLHFMFMYFKILTEACSHSING